MSKILHTYKRFRIENVGYAIANDLYNAIFSQDSNVKNVSKFSEEDIDSLIIVGGHELHNIMIFDDLMSEGGIKIAGFICAPNTLHCYKTDLIKQQICVYRNILNLSISGVNISQINQCIPNIELSFLSPESKQNDEYFSLNRDEFELKNIAVDLDVFTVYFWPLGELEPDSNYFEFTIPKFDKTPLSPKANLVAHGCYSNGISQDVLQELMILSCNNGSEIEWMKSIVKCAEERVKPLTPKFVNGYYDLCKHFLFQNIKPFFEQVINFCSNSQQLITLARKTRTQKMPAFILVKDGNRLAVVADQTVRLKVFLVSESHLSFQNMEPDKAYTLLEQFDESRSYHLKEDGEMLILVVT